MPKVSVIIPIYNIEKYIEECVVSLFEQTLDDIEYIFVNDCTPDNSIKILQQIMQKYPVRKSQVRIIEMEVNSGQAAVRKRGIAEATGEFIIFCDGDDWVDKSMYKQMYELATKHNYDVVRCLFGRISGKQEKLCKLIPTEAYADKIQLLSYLLRFSDLSSTCDKLVRRNIIFTRDFVYPKDNMCEDIVYVLQYILNARTIGYIDEPLYSYRQNSESISNVLDVDHICQKSRQISNNVGLVQTILAKADLEKNFEDEIVAARYMAKDVFRPIIEKKEIYKKWHTCFSEINSKVLFNKYITIKQKINFALCFLGLFPFVKKICKR